MTASANPDGTHTYHVATGASPRKKHASFSARQQAPPRTEARSWRDQASEPRRTQLSPSRSSYPGWRPAAFMPFRFSSASAGRQPRRPGIIFSQIFVPPAFTLNNVTAGPDGTATSTTAITAPRNFNGPGQLRIPSSGWFINVAAGRTADNGATSVACGNVVFHNAAVMRYFPRNVHIHVGDTVVWTNNTSNEIHAVTFLAGKPLPKLPGWYTSSPTGNGTATTARVTSTRACSTRLRLPE